MGDRKLTPTLLLGIAAVLAGAGVFYHYVITIPQREREEQALERARLKAEQEREAERINLEIAKRTYAEKKLEECLTTALIYHGRDWNNYCALLHRPENCTLPEDVGERLKKELREQRDECFKRFPQRLSLVGEPIAGDRPQVQGSFPPQRSESEERRGAPVRLTEDLAGWPPEALAILEDQPERAQAIKFFDGQCVRLRAVADNMERNIRAWKGACEGKTSSGRGYVTSLDGQLGFVQSITINNETTPYCQQLFIEAQTAADKIRREMPMAFNQGRTMGLLPGDVRNATYKYGLSSRLWE